MKPAAMELRRSEAHRCPLFGVVCELIVLGRNGGRLPSSFCNAKDLERARRSLPDSNRWSSHGVLATLSRCVASPGEAAATMP